MCYYKSDSKICSQTTVKSLDICWNLVVTLNFCQARIAMGTFNTLRAAWFRQFSQKNSSFRLPYQRPSSSAHCARELFSGSNGSASLVDCTQKKNFFLNIYHKKNKNLAPLIVYFALKTQLQACFMSAAYTLKLVALVLTSKSANVSDFSPNIIFAVS